jgi:predicted cupin superfamily sugar epimerase
MTRPSAAEIIHRLGLVPLPGEGGYFRETYRSPWNCSNPSGRSLTTSIYYLLTADTYSALHRLQSDEIYHFYAGDRVAVTLVDSDGRCSSHRLGSVLDADAVCQCVVPAGVWQGSRLEPGGSWALLGTTVSPGFEFADCTLARDEHLSAWPASTQLAVQSLLAAR